MPALKKKKNCRYARYIRPDLLLSTAAIIILRLSRDIESDENIYFYCTILNICLKVYRTLKHVRLLNTYLSAIAPPFLNYFLFEK